MVYWGLNTGETPGYTEQGTKGVTPQKNKRGLRLPGGYEVRETVQGGQRNETWILIIHSCVDIVHLDHLGQFRALVRVVQGAGAGHGIPDPRHELVRAP